MSKSHLLLPLIFGQNATSLANEQQISERMVFQRTGDDKVAPNGTFRIVNHQKHVWQFMRV